MSYLGTFRLQFYKIIVIFEINNLEFVELQSFIQNKKTLNLSLKMPYLRISRPESGKTIVTFEIITFEFVKMQYFMFKKKYIKFDTKIVLFGYF